ncbi:MAG: ComF family protein [Lachnospiraceae bacterium]|nr:ComF family protein [Lachnospiraceae bacterium]
MAARKIGDTAVRLLYPPRCPLCDQIRPARSAQYNLVCESCRPSLPWISEPACMKCGKPLAREESEYCEDCMRTRHLFDQGRAAFAYSGALRHSVYRMKFQNRRDYLDFYAEAMVRAGQRCLELWHPQVIVPVPMHWKKRATRGYNQSELLAVRISRLTGIPCDKKLLRCIRYTGNQKELNRRERLQNLKGSFAVRMPEPSQERVLLIDDVYTTGSTMDEAARALRDAGVRQIYFLTICTGKGKRHASSVPDRAKPRIRDQTRM